MLSVDCFIYPAATLRNRIREVTIKLPRYAQETAARFCAYPEPLLCGCGDESSLAPPTARSTAQACSSTAKPAPSADAPQWSTTPRGRRRSQDRQPHTWDISALEPAQRSAAPSLPPHACAASPDSPQADHCRLKQLRPGERRRSAGTGRWPAPEERADRRHCPYLSQPSSCMRLVVAAGCGLWGVLVLIVPSHPANDLAVRSALVAALGHQIEKMVRADDGVETARVRGVSVEELPGWILVEHAQARQFFTHVSRLFHDSVVIRKLGRIHLIFREGDAIVIVEVASL